MGQKKNTKRTFGALVKCKMYFNKLRAMSHVKASSPPEEVRHYSLLMFTTTLNGDVKQSHLISFRPPPSRHLFQAEKESFQHELRCNIQIMVKMFTRSEHRLWLVYLSLEISIQFIVSRRFFTVIASISHRCVRALNLQAIKTLSTLSGGAERCVLCGKYLDSRMNGVRTTTEQR